MNYYRYGGCTLCAWDQLPYEKTDTIPEEGELGGRPSR